MEWASRTQQTCGESIHGRPREHSRSKELENSAIKASTGEASFQEAEMKHEKGKVNFYHCQCGVPVVLLSRLDDNTTP